MTFYINEIVTPAREFAGLRILGLFTERTLKREGSFCGYYAREVYADTVLLACGVQTKDPHHPDWKAPFDKGFQVVRRTVKWIQVKSGYSERKFEAESPEEAIRIFQRQSWKDRT